MNASAGQLLDVLERAREAGFLGPGAVESHLRHSAGFGLVVEDSLGQPPENLADLGTGGGIPGLVLAVRWPQTRAVFIEAGHRRASALRAAVADLGMDDRAEVIEDRAETVGADGPLRERFDVVTARSFAPPAPTAEIAAGIVRIGGALIVSEPPEADGRRWPAERLQELGFGSAEEIEVAAGHFVVIRKMTQSPERYPRPVGRPNKRPLW